MLSRGRSGKVCIVCRVCRVYAGFCVDRKNYEISHSIHVWGIYPSNHTYPTHPAQNGRFSRGNVNYSVHRQPYTNHTPTIHAARLFPPARQYAGLGYE